MRTPLIAGNWKMNNTMSAAKTLIADLKPLIEGAEAEVAVCVPFTAIATVKKAIKGSIIKLGAQNVHFAENGAYTGEISAEMLKELKVEYIVIGHSERRQYFNETDETVNKRTAAALSKKIKPIVCIGETLSEREQGITEKVLTVQIDEGLKGFKSKDFDKIVIAYEPVWAIGTGKTATAEEANETIAFIRQRISKKFSAKIAEKVRILYGGSMNAANAKQLMSMPEIDGGLIGGASLKPNDFAKVVNYNK